MKGGKGGSGRKKPSVRTPAAPTVVRGPSRGEAKRKDWGPQETSDPDDVPGQRTSPARKSGGR